MAARSHSFSPHVTSRTHLNTCAFSSTVRLFFSNKTQKSLSLVWNKDASRNIYRIRAAFSRRWDGKIDHRGLARHREQRRFRTPPNLALPVDRYTSHVILLMQFAHLITCISHCMAQDEPPNVSVCALHSIFMSSMMCA